MKSTYKFVDVPTDAFFRVTKRIRGYKWLEKVPDLIQIDAPIEDPDLIQIDAPIEDRITLEEYNGPNDDRPLEIFMAPNGITMHPQPEVSLRAWATRNPSDPLTRERWPLEVELELIYPGFTNKTEKTGTIPMAARQKIRDYLENYKYPAHKTIKVFENERVCIAILTYLDGQSFDMLETPVDVFRDITDYGMNTVFFAAFYGRLQVVQWLVTNGGLANQADYLGRTPLNAAAVKRHLEIVQWLAANGGSVTQADTDGFTPLYIAAYYGHLEVVQWLAANGGSVVQADNDGRTPLYIAAYGGHLEVVQWLAANGGSVVQAKNDGRTPLYIAAKTGHLEVVQWLAENGASVVQSNNNGFTPLYVAAQKGHLEVVKWLVQWLVTKGALSTLTQPNNGGVTPLHVAAYNGHSEVVEWLVQFGGVDVNLQDTSTEDTALHVAVEENNVKTVKKLLELGADERKQNADGKTALDIAEEENNQLLIDILKGDEQGPAFRGGYS